MSDKLAVPSRKLLARLLDQPRLVQAVQALPPRALLGLIDHVGLEDAGEIVALATTEQLERIFDEDLWRDERFDPARFALWLEVLLEGGEALCADKLSELPEELVAQALDAHVIVIDLDELAISAVDEQLEKLLESGPSIDFEPHRVIARSYDGWDALTAALTALDQRHSDVLRRLLEQLCRASSEWIRDNGGLHHVLTAAEMIGEDAAADREARRAAAGHVSAASARAFLKLPGGDVDAILAGPRDAITRAYFREYTAPAEAAAATRDAWVEALSGEPPAAPMALLEGDAPAEETLLLRALAAVDETTAAERQRELAYLANLLLAARGGRPLEAANEALAVCNAGLQRAVAATGRAAADLLLHTGCEKLFRLGNIPPAALSTKK